MSSDSISSSARLRTLLSVRWDWPAVALVLVTLALQGTALWLTGALESVATSTPTVSTPTQATDPTLSLRFAGILIVEVLVLVGAYRLYRRLSERVRRALKWLVIGGAVVWLVSDLLAAGRTTLAAGVVGFLALMAVLLRVDLYWLLFNAVGLGLGIAVTTLLGHELGPSVVVPLLVVMLLYDLVAVDFSDLMGDIIKFSTGSGIPNYIVVPSRVRVDFGRVQEFLADVDDEEKPDDIATVIGLGDFVFPGLLTVSASVAVDGVLVPATALGSLLGACLAVGVMRAALQRRDGTLPALPWLNTGAILGFGVGAVVLVVGGVPVAEVMGL